jgi:hypothetical protein
MLYGVAATISVEFVLFWALALFVVSRGRK